MFSKTIIFLLIGTAAVLLVSAQDDKNVENGNEEVPLVPRQRRAHAPKQHMKLRAPRPHNFQHQEPEIDVNIQKRGSSENVFGAFHLPKQHKLHRPPHRRRRHHKKHSRTSSDSDHHKHHHRKWHHKRSSSDESKRHRPHHRRHRSSEHRHNFFINQRHPPHHNSHSSSEQEIRVKSRNLNRNINFVRNNIAAANGTAPPPFQQCCCGLKIEDGGPPKMGAWMKGPDPGDAVCKPCLCGSSVFVIGGGGGDKMMHGGPDPSQICNGINGPNSQGALCGPGQSCACQPILSHSGKGNPPKIIDCLPFCSAAGMSPGLHPPPPPPPPKHDGGFEGGYMD